MSRRKKNIKKEILEDPKYMNIIVSKFINILMLHGKKTIAEKILYSTLEKISTQKKTSANKNLSGCFKQC